LHSHLITEEEEEEEEEEEKEDDEEEDDEEEEDEEEKLGHMNISTRYLLHISPLYLCQIIYTTRTGKIYFTSVSASQNTFKTTAHDLIGDILIA